MWREIYKSNDCFVCEGSFKKPVYKLDFQRSRDCLSCPDEFKTANKLEQCFNEWRVSHRIVLTRFLNRCLSTKFYPNNITELLQFSAIQWIHVILEAFSATWLIFKTKRQR